jgi:restriction endonuclease S subunit
MIPIPKLELQKKFADFVRQIDKSKFLIKRQIELLEELLNKKMDEYFK